MRLQAHRLGAVRRHRRRRGQAATGVRGRLGDAQPGRLLLQRLPQQRLRARRPHSMRRHDMPRTLVGLHGRRQPRHGQRRLRPSLPCPRAAHRRGRGGAGSAGGTDGSALALQMLVDQRARWRQRWPRVVSSVSSLRCAGQPALERPRVQLALGLRLSREEPVMVGVPQRRYLNALDPRQCLLPRVELSHGARPQPRRRGGASRHDGQRGRRRVSADRAQGALYGGDLRGCHRHRTMKPTASTQSQHSALPKLTPEHTASASWDAAEHTRA